MKFKEMNESYIGNELNQIKESDKFKVTVQFSDNMGGKTKRLNIDYKIFEKIRSIMIKGN